MNDADNRSLTRVQAGTPMGDLLRQYWIPALQSTDLPERDGAPLRVRLLGENLVAFRTTDGRIGLIDHVCPHRCASLYFGRNEENGLRCLYHGWKFDVEGHCVDTPNEPPRSTLKERVHVTAYPCVERNGIVWANMERGRADLPPLPELGWAMVGPTRRSALRYQRDCNWVQAMEGDFDSSHLGILHSSFDPASGCAAADAGVQRYRGLVRTDAHPLLDVHDTDVGVMYGARRSAESGDFYWRVTQFLLPFYTSVPGYGGKNRDKVWVPLDDEHTMVWEPHWSATRELSADEQRGCIDRIGPSGFLPDTSDWLGRFRLAARVDNDYLQDRIRQKRSNFSGMENVPPIQDAAMQESMGAICDRTNEHLGAADAAIVRMRRRLLGVAADHAAGIAPPGAREPGLYRRHGDQLLARGGESWVVPYLEKMAADYASLGTG